MKILDNFIVYDKNTILDAIKKIDSNNHRICFVLNKKNKLLGSITDGDIRRSIVKKHFDKLNLNLILNKNTVFINQKNIMVGNLGDETCVPVLDKHRVLKKIKFLKKNKSLNVKTVLIMAGGEGKRLLPLTKNTPKPLIKIKKDQSMIEVLILFLKKNHIDNIKISLHHKSSLIKNFLIKRKYLNLKKKNFIIEKTPLGTAGALSLINKSEKNFLLVNCDVQLNIDLQKIIHFHINQKSCLTIVSKKLVSKSEYGELIFDKNFNLKKILEKPVNFKYINTGVYVVNQKIAKLTNNKKIDIDELIKLALEKKMKILTYPMFEYWVDLGQKSNLDNHKKFLKKN